MSVDNAILLTFVTFFAFNVANTFGECVLQTPCTCFTSSGEGYDLTKISGQNDGFINSSTVYNRTFYFHPCHNKPLSTQNANMNNCSIGDGVSLCLYDGIQQQYINFGTVNNSKMMLRSNDKPQILFDSILKNNTRVTVNISLVCNMFSNIPTLLSEYSSEAVPPNYNLVLVSPHACKTEMHTGGLSTGSVLVIIFFVFSGIYFAGGALALKIVRGATGWEMLPNQKFWCDLPALIRDGIVFTFNGCKGVSYDQI